MVSLRLRLLFGFVALLAACTPMPYGTAKPITSEATGGYLDEEISPGVFAIEVRHKSALPIFAKHEKTLVTLKEQWLRRAGELCPRGFSGTPELINAKTARIKAFQCHEAKCSNDPIASGIAWCTQRYEL